MNIKKKFERIDQSQLSEGQRAVLSKIKENTKNFTIDDEKSIEKVSNALDNIIEKLKKNNPQAIIVEKKEVEKPEKKDSETKKTEETKPKKEVTKKPTENRTKKPKKEVGGKRTVFSIAKEIRKDGESWEDAKERAKKMMTSKSTETKSKVRTETQKLLASIRRKKELKGIVGKDLDLSRDNKRTALPRGKRISKNGKIYYENRDNRSDRLAPNYKDKIYLENGGYMTITNPNEQLFKKGYRIYGGDSWESFKDVKKAYENRILPKGAVIVKVKVNDGHYFAIAEKKRDGDIFANGGSLTLTPETPLARGLGMDYTGLVGETGAMSSGEMFMAGGSAGKMKWQNAEVGDSARVKEINRTGLIVKTYGRKFHLKFLNGTEKTFDATELEFIDSKYAMGGSLENHGLKKGDEILLTLSDGVQKIKSKEGEILYVDLSDGYRDSQPPLPFSKGGALTNERRHVNKSEDYEVRYAKDKPSRAGYKGKRSFDDGGMVYVDLFQEYDKQPDELSEIVDTYMDKFEDGDYDYEDTSKFLQEVESVGYTFNYGLDNEPYGLRPIGVELNQLEGYEDEYKNGGEMPTLKSKKHKND